MDPALAKDIFDTLYGDVRGYELSFSARKKMDYFDRGLTYGEIIPKEFSRMLKEVDPQKGEVFYDLGSGTGKAVIAAALLFPFSKVVGIELLDDLYDASIRVTERLKREVSTQEIPLPEVKFIQSDFLNSDFSDADIVFAHATCFHEAQFRELLPKFEGLKKGARLLLVSKPIALESFEYIQSSEHPFSWGRATLHSYKKIV